MALDPTTGQTTPEQALEFELTALTTEAESEYATLKAQTEQAYRRLSRYKSLLRTAQHVNLRARQQRGEIGGFAIVEKKAEG